LSGKFVQHLVYGEQFVAVCQPGNFNAFNVHSFLVAAVTDRLFAAGLINEDAAHGLGGGREEMGAIDKFGFRVADQPQPRFMHERGGLQRLVGRFVAILAAASLRSSP